MDVMSIGVMAMYHFATTLMDRILSSVKKEDKILSSLGKSPKKLTNIWLKNSNVSYSKTYNVLEKAVKDGFVKRKVGPGSVTYVITKSGRARLTRHKA